MYKNTENDWLWIEIVRNKIETIGSILGISVKPVWATGQIGHPQNRANGLNPISQQDIDQEKFS